jgi:hypothetical protein
MRQGKNRTLGERTPDLPRQVGGVIVRPSFGRGDVAGERDLAGDGRGG